MSRRLADLLDRMTMRGQKDLANDIEAAVAEELTDAFHKGLLEGIRQQTAEKITPERLGQEGQS